MYCIISNDNTVIVVADFKNEAVKEGARLTIGDDQMLYTIGLNDITGGQFTTIMRCLYDAYDEYNNPDTELLRLRANIFNLQHVLQPYTPTREQKVDDEQWLGDSDS